MNFYKKEVQSRMNWETEGGVWLNKEGGLLFMVLIETHWGERFDRP